MDELWSAPAKINVSLRIGRPRSDGYHPLDSLVQTIDWNDRLRLRESDDDELFSESVGLDLTKTRVSSSSSAAAIKENASPDDAKEVEKDMSEEELQATGA